MIATEARMTEISAVGLNQHADPRLAFLARAARSRTEEVAAADGVDGGP